MMRTSARTALAILVSGMLVPATALGQAAGSSIAGVIRDTTGAVLPGVTVEASSPALIEKSRAAVSNGQGLYTIIDLRPGVYTVTFTLPGFNSVRREGLELTANFTATLNAELRVGAVEETVTVSGLSPIVDVQNVVQQRVMTREVIDALPTGKTYINLGVLVPGMIVNTHDVGGAADNGPLTLQLHGGRAQDGQIQLDGLAISNGFSAGGANIGHYVNNAVVQELVLIDGGGDAEHELAGVRSNMIPKDGANRTVGSFFTNFSNHSLQRGNLTDDLKRRGLTSVNGIDKIWDIDPALGGPILKDRLWYFTSYRHWGANTRIAGLYYDTDVRDNVFVADTTRPGVSENYHWSADLRLTGQLTPKNKVSLFINPQYSSFGAGYNVTSNTAIEATTWPQFKPQYIVQGTWSSTVSGRLLLQAAGGVQVADPNFQLNAAAAPDLPSITELRRNFTFRAVPTWNSRRNNNYSYRASATYVTGSHNAKVGMNLGRAWTHETLRVNNGMNLQVLDGVPRSVRVYALPVEWFETMKYNLGLYAQDQWRLNRLTLNLGVRADFMNAYVPAIHLGAGPYVPARDYEPVENVPNWKDFAPRVGITYDPTGRGKTVVKFAIGRYVVGGGSNFARPVDPVEATGTNVTRTWTDFNGNFWPDCDFTNPAANQECGANPNTYFGKPNPNATRFDDEYRAGFGVRGYNWNSSVSVQHELIPGMSLNAGYFHRWYGNFSTTDNLKVAPADYSEFCITVPTDQQLPGGGGNQMCGLYDLNPNVFGAVQNLIAPVAHYGQQREVYDGVDLTVNARLPHGVIFSGGLNSGRTMTDSCFIVDSPQALQFCKVQPPFLSQLKFLAVYRLPWWDLQASATFQSEPGPQITANYVVTSAQVKASLGRDLSSGASGTATIPLIQPGTMYGERLNQLDYRMTKTFRLNGARLQAMVDLYNMFNANPVLTLNTTYGPAWQQPTSTLQGTVLKVGLQLDF